MYTRGWGVDIWQEGTQIPPLKLYKKGKLDEDVMKMILNNTRFPQALENDFRGQAAACLIAAEDVEALIDKYGLDALYETYDYILDYSEERQGESWKGFLMGNIGRKDIYWMMGPRAALTDWQLKSRLKGAISYLISMVPTHKSMVQSMPPFRQLIQQWGIRSGR